MAKISLLLTLVMFFPLTQSNIHLNNVLRVPFIASNLALVHKLCHDNNCWCYFDENVLSSQALVTRKVLYQGKSEDGIYLIYPQRASQLSLSPKVCNNVASCLVVNKSLWQKRLGHPHDQVLRVLFPNVNSTMNKCNHVDNACTHCLYGKMDNQYFPKS